MTRKTTILCTAFFLLLSAFAEGQATTVTAQFAAGSFACAPPPADFTKPIIISCEGSPKNFVVKKKDGDVKVTKVGATFKIEVVDTRLSKFVLTLMADKAKSLDVTFKNKSVAAPDPVETPTAGTLNVLTANIADGVFSPDDSKADFSKPITIVAPTTVASFAVTKNTGEVTIVKKDNTHFTITTIDASQPSITVTLAADGVPALNFKITNVKAEVKPPAGKQSYTEKARHFFASDKDVSGLFNNFYRYNRKNNEAYFFFDQNGVLIGPAPVNIDADDYIQIYVAVPESSVADYAVEVEGEYNASSLNIAPHDAIAAGAAQGTGIKAEEKLTYIHQTFGPFTSETVTIKVYGKANADGSNLLKQLPVRINKLYNAGIGVTFVSTNLANPDFDVIPINGKSDKTIKKLNDGRRTLVTFNVIYYWKPTIDWITGKLKGSDHITRGRDILKEATFWERLNPTFGVALSDKWRENLFLGGNFEFTRGGSITLGWHYGKVQSLVDDKFKLGEDIFTGTKDDIKLTNSWQWRGFLGLTVDTRIFNALFSHN